MNTETDPRSEGFRTMGEGQPSDMGTCTVWMLPEPVMPPGMSMGTVVVKTPDNCQGVAPKAFAMGGALTVEGRL